MSADSIQRARDAARAWLARQDEPEAAIGACEAGAEDCQNGARRWVQGILKDQEADGSWGGELLDTAQALLTIQDLRAAGSILEQDPGVARGLDWIRARQRAPGAWTDGCSPERHERGLCHHFMTGFYSPGPAENRYEDAWLRNGLSVRGDGEVRFVASTVALRTVLRWETVGSDARLHLEGLRRIMGQWERGQAPPGLSTGGLITAVQALLHSNDPRDRDAADRGLGVVAGKQRGDGSWADADAFQALELFGVALEADVGADRSRRALEHGGRLLIASQQADGSWGQAHGARRALIGWRTFGLLEPAPD